MSSDMFEPSPLADVDSQALGERWTLVFIRDLRHPPEKVWVALTDPTRVGEWAPYLASRDLGQTGAVTLTMIDGNTTEALPATVIRAEPPTLLEHTFGTDLLRWELIATSSGTRLTLRHTVADRDWLPKVAAGWHLCLDVAERLLDGNPSGPIRGSDALRYGWDDLNDAYTTQLGLRNVI
jgi:uncharacterized protein YndB with AHSA1/START domain